MVEKISLKQVNTFLLFSVLTVGILYFAKQVLIPLTFAIFFAMLFAKMSNKMESKGIKRVFSALISVLIIVAVSFGIVTLVVMQAKKLAKDLPQIEEKAKKFKVYAETYINYKLDIPKEEQEDLISKKIKSIFESSGKGVKIFFAGIFGIMGSAVMTLIFTFLFLYQRDKYEIFFIRLCTKTQPEEAKKLIRKISTVSQSYLTGRALSIIIFTLLFTLGFLIIGLKNAFLLAFVAAILTIVPYVGSIIGGLFPFAVALITENNMNIAIGALAVIGIIQTIDNYFIEPYIIGGEVSISGFFTIFILLVGGLIWGVAGMILFLPMLGVAKIIFDSVPELSAYGYLIGDQKEGKASNRIFEKIKKIFKRK